MPDRPIHAIVLAALLLTVSGAGPFVLAQPIYKTEGPDGTPVFSDQRTPEAREVELGEANVFSEPEPVDVFEADPEAPGEGQTGPSYSVTIAAPGPEASVRSNNGDVTITANVDPQLTPGDTLELLLDGRAVATSDDGRFALDALDRGAHTIRVRAVDDAGRVHGESTTHTFYLLRASRLN